MGGPVRPRPIAGQSEDEGLGSPGRAIVAAKLPVDHPKRRVALAADRQRERQPAPDLGILAPLKDKRIILLGAARIADHVIGEPTIAGDFHHRGAERDRLGEQVQGGAAALHLYQHRPHSRLHPRIAGGDLAGTRKEGERGLGVAAVDGGTAGADQSVEIAGIVGEGGEMTPELGAPVRDERLNDRARREVDGSARLRLGAGGKDCARRQQKAAADPPQRYAHGGDRTGFTFTGNDRAGAVAPSRGGGAMNGAVLRPIQITDYSGG